MLKQAEISVEKLLSSLRVEYGISIQHIRPLGGADPNAAAFHVVRDNGQSLFLKLRKGANSDSSLHLLAYLHTLKIPGIMPPLKTAGGLLQGTYDAYAVTLYPYIDGKNGYQRELSAGNLRELGAILKQIHEAPIPPALAQKLPQESYSPEYRHRVQSYLDLVHTEQFEDAVAARLSTFLQRQTNTIAAMIRDTERLSRSLQERPQPLVICHSDLHAGNLLLGEESGLILVDWDEAFLAPAERDLMYIGGGLLASGRTSEEEKRLFFSGYGKVTVNRSAIAYYRLERIIQDIAAFCDELLLTDRGGASREQSYRYVVSNFLPDGTIELAYRAATDP